MDFRARFAPSPTGQVHIGNIRTAIFNYLETRHVKGTFLLRIEDTDLERSTQDAIDKLLDCMKWLGMDYDEEILYQTSQSPLHVKAAEKLKEDGDAYLLDPAAEKSPLLFRLPYDCDSYSFVREVGEAVIHPAPGTPVTLNLCGVVWNTVTPKGKIADNSATLAGFKNLRLLAADGTELFSLTPETMKTLSMDPAKKLTFENCAEMRFIRREVFFRDMVKGELAKPMDGMKDFIIIRTDGSPVFHLANVYDDITQKVTHIVRGDDHVENTYRHLFLFAKLGAEIPTYAHLPMIVNQAGKPYSKRDGDAFVGDFRNKGFLPQALFNYLTLLGWSPGDDREKMSREELIEAFSLDRALCSPAQFDIQKLTNLNARYIAELPEEKYLEMVRPFAPAGAAEHPRFRAAAQLMHSRVKTFADASAWGYFFCKADELVYDPKGMKKFLSDETARKGAGQVASAWEAMAGAPLSAEQAEAAIREAETSLGLGQGKLNQAVRIAITGTTVGAGIYETASVLGSAESAARIRRALTQAL